jgi:hypothetical protein
MTTSNTDYTTLPDPPPSMSAGAVLSRLCDGIGFRYRWATEGISLADLGFSPGRGCMTLGELLAHILELLEWVARHLGMDVTAIDPAAGSTPADPAALRSRTIGLAADLAARFRGMTDADLEAVRIRSSRGNSLPLWNVVNGPLADSLTHVGQVLSWRRLAGSPPPASDVFRGRPPRPR